MLRSNSTWCPVQALRRLRFPALVAAASWLFSIPATAQDLFWTDATPASAIYRMHADGSMNHLVLGGLSHARGLAIDQLHQRMYWFNAGTDEIWYAHLDGLNPLPIIFNVHESYGVAIDEVAGKIYWCSANQPGTTDSIWCANLDGTQPTQLISTGLVEPIGIAVDVVNGWLFWSDLGNSTISRVRLDGMTDRSEIVMNTGGWVYPLTIDQERGYLYWGVIPQPAAADSSIHRAHLDGSSPETLFSGLWAVGAIVLEPDEGALVWTETDTQHNPQIVRGNLTTHATTVIHSGSGGPWGLARLGGSNCGPDIDTLAYYRFESGVAGNAASGTASVPSTIAGAASGTPTGGPVYGTSTFGASIPQTGANNDLCLEFDGVNDDVHFNEPFLFSRPLAGATFEMWFKLPDQPHAAILWGDPSQPQDPNRFHLYTIPGGGIGMDYSNGTLHTILPAGPFNVTANQWTHFAATKERLPSGDDRYSFYKNGIPVYSTDDLNPVLPTDQIWSIGGRPTNPLLGQIDEVRCTARVLDPSEFLNAPFLDVDGNGVPDSCECTATNYCIAAPNSLGHGAHMDLGGMPSISQGSLTLICTGCPPNASGLFFYGAGQAQVPFGNGFRCVAGPIHRLGFAVASSSGTAARTLNYSTLLPGATISAGSTWNFQFWYRNPAGGGQGFNLSDGLSIRFCP